MLFFLSDRTVAFNGKSRILPNIGPLNTTTAPRTWSQSERWLSVMEAQPVSPEPFCPTLHLKHTHLLPVRHSTTIVRTTQLSLHVFIFPLVSHEHSSRHACPLLMMSAAGARWEKTHQDRAALGSVTQWGCSGAWQCGGRQWEQSCFCFGFLPVFVCVCGWVGGGGAYASCEGGQGSLQDWTVICNDLQSTDFGKSGKDV